MAGPAVGGGDVVEVLGRVVDAGDVLDWGEGGPLVRLGEAQVGSEGLVQGHMVAVQGVGTEGDVVDAHELDAVQEVVHDRLQRVLRVVMR